MRQHALTKYLSQLRRAQGLLLWRLVTAGLIFLLRTAYGHLPVTMVLLGLQLGF